MPQPPGFEPLEQSTQFGRGEPHFLLIIHKTSRLVVRNGIVILPHVGQYAQQPLALCPADFLERTGLSRPDQRDHGSAILRNETMTQVAQGELV
jgi:hypothetical protein